MAEASVLSIQDLSLEFPIYKGAVKALNGVSLHVAPREIVGVVGESGSGKSVTSMLAMRLLVDGSYRVTGGAVSLLGEDVLRASERTMLGLRGSRVAMIFQEPMTALNPTRKVGDQMVEVLRLHRGLTGAKALTEAAALLRDMHVGDPDAILKVYPFELSGGMRQRVLLALAFSCEPELLIADEPTTALDVTVQRQVLLLMREQARQRNTAILFITHDMAVVSQFCDRVYVMYAGEVVEGGEADAIFHDARHPYTRALLACDPARFPGRLERLPTIPGTLPNLMERPAGCIYASRCDRTLAACQNAAPPRVELSASHYARCHGVRA